MAPASPQPVLDRLRQTLAGIDPSNAPRLAGEECLVGLTGPIDAALGGGLACGVLHELAPVAPVRGHRKLWISVWSAIAALPPL